MSRQADDEASQAVGGRPRWWSVMLAGPRGSCNYLKPVPIHECGAMELEIRRGGCGALLMNSKKRLEEERPMLKFAICLRDLHRTIAGKTVAGRCSTPEILHANTGAKWCWNPKWKAGAVVGANDDSGAACRQRRVGAKRSPRKLVMDVAYMNS